MRNANDASILQFKIPLTRKHSCNVHAANHTTSHPKLTPLQKNLLRAHRWLHTLETGQAKNLKDLARQANVDPRYVNRILNLTALAPDIVADILNNKLPDHVTISTLTINTPRLWVEQSKILTRITLAKISVLRHMLSRN